MDEEGGGGSLPLGAQQQTSNDTEEEEHFQQVCKAYQQYATFHQTKQQGITRRICQLINKSRQQQEDISNNTTSPPNNEDIQQQKQPTIESILPPSLHPQSSTKQQYIKQYNESTIRNQYYLDCILKYSNVATSQDVLRQRKQASTAIDWTTEDQISKIDSVLKSVVRDWSLDGKEERSVVYDRIIDALVRYMPLGRGGGGATERSCCNDDKCTSNNMTDESYNNNRKTSSPRVAVPGSGLGRLAWEIYSRGYSVQGSDFSLHMLLASDFMLNGCGIPPPPEGEEVEGERQSFKQFGICPWIGETKNVMSFEERLRTVVVPDVDPTSLLVTEEEDGRESEFTMLAGEFLHLYSHFLPENQSKANDEQHPKAQQKFHAIACSFFLDTAPSLPHYLLTIYHMLEADGLLINFGPLMYHWSGHGSLLPGDTDVSQPNGGGSSAYQRRNKHLDDRYLTSIDYTWEEVRYMILQCGFEIVEEETYIPAKYTSDNKSMMKVMYDCVFMVARKKSTASAE